MILDAGLIQHQVAQQAVSLPDGTAGAESHDSRAGKSPSKNHTLCVVMVMRKVEFPATMVMRNVEFPAILTVVDPS